MNAARAVQTLWSGEPGHHRRRRDQAPGRHMGTTAVVALQQERPGLRGRTGRQPRYLIRGDRVEQLTIDHTVAEALVPQRRHDAGGGRSDRWVNVLYKFLGCVEMTDGAEVPPFEPHTGDRLLLGTDGLTNHISHADLRESVARYPHPQELADYLVDLALTRGSRDNVTCVVVAFDKESEERAV